MFRINRFAASIFWVLGLLLLSGTPAVAQVPASSYERGKEIHVYLLTMGPGEEVYEKFGHNALVIENQALHQSLVYNYGVFQFDQDFLPHFLQGKMRYWMERDDLGPVIGYYKSLQRTIGVQELNLIPTQRAKLADFLERNSQEDQKYYYYNYYTANCSTKVRDALDLALDGQLQAQLKPLATGTTYRWQTLRIMQNDLVIYIGLDFILGHATDKPLTAWQESFLPMALQAHLRKVMVRDEAGKPAPLVLREWTLYQSPRPPLAPIPPHWIPQFLLAGCGLGLVLALAGWLTRKTAAGRWIYVPLAILWSLLAGGAGVYLCWSFTTEHVAVYWNENLFQFAPFALPLAILIPLTVFSKRLMRWALGAILVLIAAAALIALTIPIAAPAVRACWQPLLMGLILCALALCIPRRLASRGVLILAAIVAGCSIVGLILKLLPSFDQANGEMIAWTLPAHAGLLLGAWWMLRPRADSSQQPKMKGQ